MLFRVHTFFKIPKNCLPFTLPFALFCFYQLFKSAALRLENARTRILHFPIFTGHIADEPQVTANGTLVDYTAVN